MHYNHKIIYLYQEFEQYHSFREPFSGHFSIVGVSYDDLENHTKQISNADSLVIADFTKIKDQEPAKKWLEQKASKIQLVFLITAEQGEYFASNISQYPHWHIFIKPQPLILIKNTLDTLLLQISISEEKNNLEIQIGQQKSDLEKMVKVRTLELEQKKIQMQEAILAKDKLFSVISHDLMTPMLSLGILLDVIIKSKENLTIEKLNHYSQKIKSYLGHVNEMLENLLNWSVSQMESNTPTKRLVKVNYLLKQNFELFKISADKKKINLQLQKSPDLQVLGDENMINLIIRNLVSNAIKFTHVGGTVSISAHQRDNETVICISDTGTGIDQNILPHLFDKDFHESTSGTQEEKGAGIGLKLCKEFSDKLGGRIWVEKTSSQGSTFCFCLSGTN